MNSSPLSEEEYRSAMPPRPALPRTLSPKPRPVKRASFDVKYYMESVSLESLSMDAAVARRKAMLLAKVLPDDPKVTAPEKRQTLQSMIARAAQVALDVSSVISEEKQQPIARRRHHRRNSFVIHRNKTRIPTPGSDSVG